MAHVKNTGRQPRGFWDDAYNHIVVMPGQEALINMNEGDYKKIQELLENEDDPKPFTLEGGHSAAKPKKGEAQIRQIEDKQTKAAEKDEKK